MQRREGPVEIRFDHGPLGDGACVFTAPSRMIVADEAGDVPDALRALDEARAAGRWLAGYASYEFGYALEPRLAPLMPKGRRLPLLSFGVYDTPETAPELPRGDASLSGMTPKWDAARYK